MQRSYYAIIPANVRYDKNLPDGAKLLYGEITALCNEVGYCWASNKYFADLYGKSSDTISRYISALAKNGYILSLVDNQEGNSRKIWIADPIGKNAATLSAKMPIPSPQKRSDPIRKNADIIIQYNNTLNNSTNNSASAEKNDFYTKKEIEAAKAEIDDLINPKKETAPPVPAAPPAEKTEFEKWLDVLDDDYRIKEGFCITQKVPEHLFSDYVKRFKALANTQVEKYVRKHDLTGHFLNWSGSEYRKEKKEQQAQTSQAVGGSMVNKSGLVTPLPY